MLMVVVAAVAMICLGGCCHPRVCVTPYWQVVTTDFEGCWIAEYVAEGDVLPTSRGYCFRAVERRIFKPAVLTFKYPLGRPVKVEATNIIVTPTCKPLWLQEVERTMPPADQCAVPKTCWKKR